MPGSGTLLLLATFAGAAPPSHAVAVFPIRPVDVPEFDAKKLEKFGDLLDSVVSSHGIPTVPRSDLRSLIRREQAETFKDCYDESCQIELGKAVAASKILASTWSKFGNSCVLALRLHDLRTELTEFSTTQEVPCTETGLKQAVTNAGLELADLATAEPDTGGSGRISSFSPSAQGKSIQNPQTDKRGYFFVKSDPPGARVFINGEERGATPYQVELMTGRYVLILTAGALYKPYRQTLTLTPKGTKLEAKLAPNFGVLRVETTPEGASISIDGEPTGQQTPHSFPPKKSGSYRVSVTHPLYFSAEQSARLGQGKEERVQFVLKPNYGSLAVASEPAGVSIAIDGVDTGMQTPALIEKIGDGTHRVVVQNEQWKSDAQQVSIRRGARAATSFVLQGRYGVMKAAAVVRDRDGVRPAEATVEIDGEAQKGTTPFERRLLVGKHTVVLSITGARPVREDVWLREGETVRVEGELTFLSEAEIADVRRREANRALRIVEKDERESRESGRSVAVWTGTGGVIAALAGGTFLGLANAAASRANSASTVADLESARSFGGTAQTTGWIALSVGGAALATSAVLYLTNREPAVADETGGDDPRWP